MESRRVLRVFLASSSDVAAERKIVREVVESWNRVTGIRRGWHVDVFGWETHGSPDYGRDPQSIINRQIGNMGRYALFVGILKHRFGTPTPRAGSGTNEEFQRAVKAWKSTGRLRIMLYFSDAALPKPTKASLEQKQKVLDFQQKVQPLSLHWTYRTSSDFRRLFGEHFARWMEGQRKTSPKASPKRSRPRRAPDSSPPAKAKTSRLSQKSPVRVTKRGAGSRKTKPAARPKRKA